MSEASTQSAKKLYGELQLPFDHTLYKGEIFPPVETSVLDETQEFELRDGDVFVATFPKSGTTWTQKIIHSLHDIHGTGQFKDFKDQNFQQMITWLDLYDKTNLKTRRSPRYFKTHTSYKNVAKDGTKDIKYIYIARNPKDTCVSLYYHCVGFSEFKYEGPFEEFGELFIKGHVESSDWWEHVRDYYVNSRNMNILFLKYEDMQKDPALAVKQINDYCGLPELSEAQIQSVVKATTFQKMKSSPDTDCSWTDARRRLTATPFLRKGVVGDWKTHFTEELSERFDEKTRSLFSDINLEFDYHV